MPTDYPWIEFERDFMSLEELAYNDPKVLAETVSPSCVLGKVFLSSCQNQQDGLARIRFLLAAYREVVCTLRQKFAPERAPKYPTSSYTKARSEVLHAVFEQLSALPPA